MCLAAGGGKFAKADKGPINCRRFHSSVWPISPSPSTGKEEITRCLQGAMEEEAGSRLGVNERTHLIV